MKHQIIVSTLVALVVFAATATAEAGIFGRLSTVWHGCNACEPVACQPCEPPACMPCEVVACEPVCDPCVPMCDPCGTPAAYRPFRPFGGFFASLAGAPLAACVPCGEVVACDPCEPVCEPICDPCEVVCDPCAVPAGHFLPFNGFFRNLGSRVAAPCAVGCVPCEPVCDPCEPVCDPCQPCM